MNQVERDRLRERELARLRRETVAAPIRFSDAQRLLANGRGPRVVGAAEDAPEAMRVIENFNREVVGDGEDQD